MKSNESVIAILGIGTAVPDYRIDQNDAAQTLAQALSASANPDSARWAKRIFRQCGVKTRYTCEPELLESADECQYLSYISNRPVPTTADRMNTYKREAVPLGLKAAKKAMIDGQVDSSEVTHLITVSCTGQFLPGLDTEFVKGLGLRADVHRIPLNFIGCAAGLKGIGLARRLVIGDPGAKILLVCVELCTIHIQPSSERDALFGASFFGDGASACIIGQTIGEEDKGFFQLEHDRSILFPNSEKEMVWEVGNYGFDLYLSPDIPKLIGTYVPEQVEQLFDGEPLPELWAIHPGGKGIIDILSKLLNLTEEQTMPSRTVLRDYGNLSSATILFVLQNMQLKLEQCFGDLKESNKLGENQHRDYLNEQNDTIKEVNVNIYGKSGETKNFINGIAIAFGPGLTCEMIPFKYVPKIRTLAQHFDVTYV